jgi:sterol desaturase/sphingolipid hydroxylase (fatty acid hydroxylase superfamily)
MFLEQFAGFKECAASQTTLFDLYFFVAYVAAIALFDQWVRGIKKKNKSMGRLRFIAHVIGLLIVALVFLFITSTIGSFFIIGFCTSSPKTTIIILFVAPVLYLCFKYLKKRR